MLVTDCKVDPKRLGVLAECLSGDPHEGEWPNQYLSAQTVAYSCGMIARFQEVVVHAHDPEELKLCRRLAGKAAKIMAGECVGLNDEGDHTLDPFYIPVNSGDPVPKKLNEEVFRKAMRGTIYQGALLEFEPIAKTSGWFQIVSKVDPSYPDEPGKLKSIARWGELYDWFAAQKDLHSQVYIGFKEPPGEGFAVIYPKLFLGLTAAGSLVGLATCVVWT